MKLAPRQRFAVLGFAVFATLAAAAWVGQEDKLEQPVSPAARSGESFAATRGMPETLPAVKGLPAERASLREAEQDIFTGKSWLPPPPPPLLSPSAPPAAPVAPPLPFKFLGKFQEEAGRTLVYLQEGENLRTAGAGDVIEGKYRVESVEGNQVVFTYLPLNTKQTLTLGGGS